MSATDNNDAAQGDRNYDPYAAPDDRAAADPYLYPVSQDPYAGQTQVPYPQPQQTVYPRMAMQTDRSFWKVILLGFITLGIYSAYVIARSGEDLNQIEGPYDHHHSMNYWLVWLVLGPLTLGIVPLVWWTRTSNRIGTYQLRQGLLKTVDASTFWLWGVLGSLIVVGPFIFIYKWLEGMNTISEYYNQHG